MTLDDLKSQLHAAVTATLGSELDLGLMSLGVSADPKFGDYTTNAAMVYAKTVGRAPREVAEELARALEEASPAVARAEVAGPGFINITLAEAAVAGSAEAAVAGKYDRYAGQEVVTEFSDPNPFKVLHVGHLYTTVVGEAISNLVRLAGGRVHAVNFGGDVGLHVGKTLWAILEDLGGEHPEKLADIPEERRSEWMAECYVKGSAAYEDDEAAAAAIKQLNAKVYKIHQDSDHESDLAQIYWTGRRWSYEYFDMFYARIGAKFEKYYPESETAPLGLETVKEQLTKGVYSESDGAVVFEGEKFGLHTRVFISSQGLPTYEAKDVGLIMAKWRDYKFDKSIVITGNDITEYMKVVLKSVEQFAPGLAERTVHLTHGNVKLAGGAKMSSRKGNFLRAIDVLELARDANLAAGGTDDERVVLGAVKYSFLKQRIGADMVFIPEESVSLDGNSGPYLQYAHARARSIMAKAQPAEGDLPEGLDAAERTLAVKIAEYPAVVERAIEELMPHYICTYLYDLAQVFNRFYEASRVIGDEREQVRLRLVTLYAGVLQQGLQLLGIDAPERL